MQVVLQTQKVKIQTISICSFIYFCVSMYHLISNKEIMFVVKSPWRNLKVYDIEFCPKFKILLDKMNRILWI